MAQIHQNLKSFKNTSRYQSVNKDTKEELVLQKWPKHPLLYNITSISDGEEEDVRGTDREGRYFGPEKCRVGGGCWGVLGVT